MGETTIETDDKMVQFVERMLDLNRKKAEERNPETLRRIDSDIAITDRQIDRLVYQLYALTPEEISIVEGDKGCNGMLARLYFCCILSENKR